MEGFKLEMEQELQTLRFELEDEGKAMLGTVFFKLGARSENITYKYLLIHVHAQTYL